MTVSSRALSQETPSHEYAQDVLLLKTKLYVPPPRPKLIRRPRLVERLDEVLHHKLTLVAAPAGYGKSTLLSEWLRQDQIPAAWLSLDETDNDLARFLMYVVAALRTIESNVDIALQDTRRALNLSPVETFLTRLISSVTDIPDHFVLVLDDYQLIEAEPVHNSVTFLLEHMPPRMHLVIATRADPPLPLSRLRGRGQLTELRTADLRFTPAEATAFLNDVMDLGLAAEQVAALETHTEGWIVGLQMAAFSMQTRDSEQIARFVSAFSGSHRYILDYLTDEVLLQQPEEVRSFLMQTAILARLTGDLCDAVTGRNDGAEMLARLEAANLFIVPLDDERRWSRYHHLFADLLHSRLEDTLADQLPQLHRRASEWYERQGMVVDAMGHALAAGDIEWIEHLIVRNALAIIYHGELGTVTGWLDALPHEVVRARPRLRVVHAWTLAHAGQLDDVEPLLREAEKRLDELEQPDQARQIAGYIAAIRAYVAGLRSDVSHSADLARQALDSLPQTDMTARGWTALVLGCALRSQGKLAEAAAVFDEARVICRATGDIHLSVDVLWEQAVLMWSQGQLHQVMRTCEDALRLADEYTAQSGGGLPVTGYTYSLMSGIAYEWNDLEAALRYARKGLKLSQRWEQADALMQAFFRLANVLDAMGETQSALDAIQEASQVAERLGGWYVLTSGVMETGIRLAQGDLAAASRWAAACGCTAQDEPGFDYISCYRMLARVLTAQGQATQAFSLLERLLAMADAVGATAQVIRILVLQAVALQALDQQDRAVQVLERALVLAEPEGYVRSFIEEGAAVGALLREAAARGTSPAYAARLLIALEDETKENRQGMTPARRALVEALTEREQQVLRLIAAGLSNRTIAEELYLSVNTVKTHTKAIYGKLDVHSRTQAVQQARDLGLLPT